MPGWSEKKYATLIASLVLGNLIFLAIFGARTAGILESSELTAYDFFIRIKPRIPIDDRIVIIGETEQDLQRFGHPLPDKVLAQALERLTLSGPRAIGVDKYRDIPVPPGTKRLDSILMKNHDIIWIMQFGSAQNANIAPPGVLQNTDQIGFNTVLPDKDGIIRRGLLFLDHADTVGYSFALMLALRYLEKDGIYPAPDATHPEYMKLGNTTIIPFEAHDGGYVDADARGYQFLLDYSGMPTFFKMYTLSELLDGNIPRQSIENKVVIIGAISESLNDFFFSPFNRGMEQKELVYGVELHSHIVSQLLRFATHNTPIMRVTSSARENWWIWIWCVAGGLLGIWIRTLTRFLTVTLSGVTVILLACYLAFIEYWWMPLIPPLYGFFIAAAVVTAYMTSREKAERQMVMNLFAKHVSSDVAETIWQEREQFLASGRLRPQRITATVLFTDIKGFTSVSEKMDPQELMDWLNYYMEHMAQVVIKHGGSINKYIGDAIMAVFGVPLYRDNEKDIALDAQRAVDCALAMDRELARMNARWAEQGLPTIGMRVGIYTGPLVAGSLGSSERLEYTVIGDTVNTASRLESFVKSMNHPGENMAESATNCRILIGDSTRNYLAEKTYNISHIGVAKLKGKEDDVDIYWITDSVTEMSDK